MFLSPGAKIARKDDVGRLLYRGFLEQHGETNMGATPPEYCVLTELRTVVSEKEMSVAYKKRLLSYIAALLYILRTIKAVRLRHPVLWSHACDEKATHSSCTLALDIVSSLYNLAICNAHLARHEQRHHRLHAAAAERARNYFLVSAGAFDMTAFLAEEPYFASAMLGASDLNPLALKAAKAVMLGNAQQVLFLEAEAQQPSAAMHQQCAEYAASAAHYYKYAAECCKEHGTSRNRMETALGLPAATLGAYFEARAQFAMARALDAKLEMSEQLARLAAARRACDSADKYSKKLNTKPMRHLSSLQKPLRKAVEELDSDLRERSKTAEQENLFVYGGVNPMRKIPAIPIRGAQPPDIHDLLSSTAVDERLSALKDPPKPPVDTWTITGMWDTACRFVSSFWEEPQRTA